MLINIFRNAKISHRKSTDEKYERTFQSEKLCSITQCPPEIFRVNGNLYLVSPIFIPTWRVIDFPNRHSLFLLLEYKSIHLYVS